VASEIVEPLTPLGVYRRAFVATSNDHLVAHRNEIVITIEPGDEIATVAAHVIPAKLGHTKAIPVLKISSPSRDVLEITGLSSSRTDVVLTTDVTGNGLTVLARARSGDIEIAEMTITFNLWEACTPPTGSTPYVSSTLGVTIDVLNTVGKSILMTLSTPATSSPRATRGNYSLAYPSRTERERRMTNLYFPSSSARLSYTFASDLNLTTPWLNIGRAGVTAIAIFVVAALASHIPEGDRFTALIAVFIGAAGLLWDFSREVTSFAVYSATKSWISITVLVAQLLVLALLGSAVFALTEDSALLAPSGLIALGVGSLLLGLAVLALIAHRQGFWQNYRCDAEGCPSVFRWRRSRPECSYTGRVHCPRHVASLCKKCVHGPDLGASLLTTANSYGVGTMACLSSSAGD
jgi:hypothetical protein